jgi:hypothetical protein
MLNFVELYEHGVITKHEAVYQIFDRATFQDFEELPESWQDDVRELVNRDWDNVVFAHSWCAPEGAIQPTQELQRKLAKKRASFWKSHFS